MGGGGMKGSFDPWRALGRVAKNSADVYVVSTVPARRTHCEVLPLCYPKYLSLFFKPHKSL